MNNKNDLIPRLVAPWGNPEHSANSFSRRSALKMAIGATGLAAAGSNQTIAKEKPDPRKSSPKKFSMKKSINLWAFPYPDKMNLRECLQLA